MRNPFSRRNIFATEEEEEDLALPVTLAPEMQIPEVDPDEQRFEELYQPGEQQKALIEHLLAGSPDRADYKPGIGRSILAALGGGLKTIAAGGDQRAGSQFVEKVVSSPYRNAVEDYGTKSKELQTAATVEGMQRDDQRGLLGHRLGEKKLKAREASDLARMTAAEAKESARQDAATADRKIDQQRADTMAANAANANRKTDLMIGTMSAKQAKDEATAAAKEVEAKIRKDKFSKAHIDSFNKETKPLQEADMKFRQLESLVKNSVPSGVTDLDIIMSHLNQIDETAARDAEVNNILGSAPMMAQWGVTLAKYVGGDRKVPNSVIKQIYADAQKKNMIVLEILGRKRAAFTSQAEMYEFGDEHINIINGRPTPPAETQVEDFDKKFGRGKASGKAL